MVAAKLNTFVHSLRTMRFGATFIFVSSVFFFLFFSVCRRCQRLYRLFAIYVNLCKSGPFDKFCEFTFSTHSVSNLRVVNSVGVAFVLENLKSFCRNRRQKCIFMDAAKFSLFFSPPAYSCAYEIRPYIVLSEFASSLNERRSYLAQTENFSIWVCYDTTTIFLVDWRHTISREHLDLDGFFLFFCNNK